MGLPEPGVPPGAQACNAPPYLLGDEMAKFVMSSFQKKKHEKAFEFYTEVDSEGKRRSNNAIAKMVGCSPAAVAYWKKRDNWDAKLLAKIDEAIDEAVLTNRNIKKLLRESLFKHIKSLNTVIEFSKSDADKVTAIKAFVHVAKELDCLTPDTGVGEMADNVAPSFKDDIHEPEQAGEGAAGAGASADGAGGSVGVGSELADAGTSGSDPVFAVHPAQSVVRDVPDELESGFKAAGL